MNENKTPNPSKLKRFLSCFPIVLTGGVVGCLIMLPFLPWILKPIVGDIFRRGYDTFYIGDSMRVCVSRGRLPESWDDLKIGFDAIYGESHAFENFESSDAFYEDMTTRIDMNFETFRKINERLDIDGDISVPEDEHWVFRWKDRPLSKKFQREKFDEMFEDLKRHTAMNRERKQIETDHLP